MARFDNRLKALEVTVAARYRPQADDPELLWFRQMDFRARAALVFLLRHGKYGDKAGLREYRSVRNNEREAFLTTWLNAHEDKGRCEICLGNAPFQEPDVLLP